MISEVLLSKESAWWYEIGSSSSWSHLCLAGFLSFRSPHHSTCDLSFQLNLFVNIYLFDCVWSRLQHHGILPSRGGRAQLHGSLWDLSSPVRDQIHVHRKWGGLLTTGPPGKSQLLTFDHDTCKEEIAFVSLFPLPSFFLSIVCLLVYCLSLLTAV